MSPKIWPVALLFAVILMILASCVDPSYYPQAVPTPTPIMIAGVEITLTVNGSNLDVVLVSPSTGWVGVGFNTSAAKGGNIIIGYVDGTGAHVRDDNMSSWPHAPDTQQDVSNVSGLESAGKTELHFTIPLNSGDADDIVLTPGNTYNIFSAYSSADDYTTYHDARDYGQITL